MKSRFLLYALLPAVLLLFAQLAQAQLPNFVELAERNSPSVVNISTKQSGSGAFQRAHPFTIPQLPEGSPFNELFKHFFGEIPFDPQEMPEFKTESLGSGFVISNDGYILTNHHVVSGADEVIVRLSDRREFIADVVGSDKQTDVALLKIDAENLPVVTIGSAADLKVGEWVLAIGSPFGFDHSVTAGIVSAKGRNLPTENYVPFIQTDVAINPGNSGGPLFNLAGEVVGVNSQIYSRTGGFMGLSFSIPIEMAMNVADQLRTTGRVQRGWLGVLIQDVTLELAESFGMSKPHGALVARVIPGGPAEKAGVEVGDIIVRFNDREVEQSSKLPPMVGSSKINETARLVVLRDGKERLLTVTIGELPDDDQVAAAPAPTETDQSAAVFGLIVSELTPAQRREYNLSSGGVLVQEVLDGPAKTAGIRAGEVIVMIRNHRILGVADFYDQVAKLTKPAPIALLVQDTEGSRWITLRPAN